MIENPAAFFADFGIDATVSGSPVRGILDDATATSFGLVSGTTPVFICATSDVVGVARGSLVEIGVKSYEVAEIRLDGTGMTGLLLEEA